MLEEQIIAYVLRRHGLIGTRVCAEIRRACIGDDPDKRPDMRCIIEMLDEAENNVDALYVELDVMERILEGSKKPSILSHQLLLFITGIFSREQEIGRSEYAITYRGILRQRSVAVKRLLMTIGFNDQMFQNQIKTMTLAQHKNIVQFLGYCSYTQQEAGEFDMADMRERLLCFEDLSNGSLDRYVSDASLGLEWSVRYQIIMGICEGLHYLHRKKIVLGELRTTNILLDDKMVPKIDIFCLSRCFVEHQSRAIAPIKMESMGYMAPEAFAGFITFMSDIYSLGIIITEILTERKDLAKENVLESWRTKLGTSSTDVLLEQVRVCAEISMACKNPNPERRPDMQRIIKMLDETESKGPAEQ
ncbi:putative receptor-like protein kinase At4g00960 isoform X1 [Panicum virgatum]|uniref:Protein kinase domain-containing protein n=1 Tax=Panicum virgatum TaxID=38727 RepID=A0A8T0R9P8_PANVG|nr:putative receptor-like protein kinase At4g00960 isoform X1 [Panicum virgatum]XP_039853402.1 putative receptor-like protein kinase At4g00960 isoform X1 [Panicum virgatum]XP_039853403.1 putative receptor-like protein kinase At4g00960 isoform X1 [Panicum virgatum]XP_039853404.1 putative receptor-like protein kinase At4g00960 isoform X1 [Panicum virgatum]XP_039853405.1 putative receptor-like protein kinase At4g00960 isoform X1 [Panicum virgatum]XP_039853406.1 putative receptor-like protein kina